jgi:ribosomal protein S18 acetylase RimI-like enzyme
MKSILHTLVNESEMNEMGIRRVERLSGSHIGQQRQETIDYAAARANRPETRSYEEVAADLRRALKSVTRSQITMEKPSGSRYYYPRFPREIVALFEEIKRINESRMKSDFGSWRDVYPTSSGAIHFATDAPSDFQRSHFPDGGISPSLRGIGLGYKLYRALLATTGYISSNPSGTREKDKAWGSLLSYKQNADGTPSEDDAHAIIGPGNWMAIDKTFNQNNKISRAMDFIEQRIGFSNTKPDRFDIDDELLSLLPDAFLSRLDAGYLRSLVSDNRLTQEKYTQIMSAQGEAQRLEAERQERREREERERRQRQEQELITRFASRIRQFGADLNADWEVGDFIVLRSYLLQDYAGLPIRQVVNAANRQYTAVSIGDAVRIANGQMTWREAGDTRTTSNKAEWVKVNIEDIPDLDAVNLRTEEKEFLRTLISPERREALARERSERERARLDQEAQDNAERATAAETYGQTYPNSASVYSAIEQRDTLPNVAMIKTVRGQDPTIIALTDTQVTQTAVSSVAAYVPVLVNGRSVRVATEADFTNPAVSQNIRLLNMVNGFMVNPPLSGLNFKFFRLTPATRDDKRQVRAGDNFYISTHRNVYGVVAKAAYGTRNRADQPFIYMNVAPTNRPFSVRVDMLKKLGSPLTITDLANGVDGNQ